MLSHYLLCCADVEGSSVLNFAVLTLCTPRNALCCKSLSLGVIVC